MKQHIPVLREDVTGRKELVLQGDVTIYPSLRRRIEEGGVVIVFMDVEQ